MPYEAQNFDHLLGLPGFSDQLLKNHFTLYQGYVTNTNKLLDTFAAMNKEGKAGTPEYNELKRRFGWEFNGMRLHEYYFGSQTKTAAPLDATSPLGKALAEQFGSYDAWKKDFTATGMMRGMGWAILYYDTQGKRLLNVWVNEHDAGHLAGETILLNVDVFEHAFMLDYGLKRADYLDASFNVIDWNTVAQRFSKTS